MFCVKQIGSTKLQMVFKIFQQKIFSAFYGFFYHKNCVKFISKFLKNYKNQLTNTFNFQVPSRMKHGSGLTPYNSTIINTTVHFCDSLNGTDYNPTGKWVLDCAADQLPKGTYRPCPYFGQIKYSNISLKVTSVLSQFLSGRYKITARSFDEKDDNVITFKLEAETRIVWKRKQNNPS
jgi:hypothetical protein